MKRRIGIAASDRGKALQRENEERERESKRVASLLMDYYCERERASERVRLRSK